MSFSEGFKPIGDFDELVINLLAYLAELGDMLRRTNTGNHVFHPGR
jgi:hypothetical protein